MTGSDIALSALPLMGRKKATTAPVFATTMMERGVIAQQGIVRWGGPPIVISTGAGKWPRGERQGQWGRMRRRTGVVAVVAAIATRAGGGGGT